VEFLCNHNTIILKFDKKWRKRRGKDEEEIGKRGGKKIKRKV
jgi:undecaprenyl pyrophosphate synthase